MEHTLTSNPYFNAYINSQSPITNLNPLEDSQNPVKQYELGLSYKEGNGAVKDNKTAFFYFKQAADKGHAEAQFQIGIMYKRGIGCAEDRLKAINYFEQAAGGKHALAKCYSVLERMYEAVEIFKRASPNSWLSFNNALSGWQDPPAYCEEMERCNGDIARLSVQYVEAQFIYAWIISCHSKLSMTKTMVEDFHQKMMTCAAKGYAPAQYKLGLMLHEVNNEEALDSLRQAASQGYAPAQYQLSVRLKTLHKQEKESSHYLMQAANQQYPLALNEIANQYFQFFAVKGQLYDGLGNGQTNLLSLPQEIAEKITSYNVQRPLSSSTPRAWFDDMLEMIRWDNRGFRPDV